MKYENHAKQNLGNYRINSKTKPVDQKHKIHKKQNGKDCQRAIQNVNRVQNYRATNPNQEQKSKFSNHIDTILYLLITKFPKNSNVEL